jgi:hypothetical protein
MEKLSNMEKLFGIEINKISTFKTNLVYKL